MDGNTFSSSISLPCGEQQVVQNFTFTRYFIIKRIDNNSNNSFKNTSPFLISKTFHSVLGDVPSIKKLKSGDLLVEVSSAKQSNILATCSEMGSFVVSVEKHPTLNTCRGVISEPDLLFSTKEEILENLESQNVIDARRITIRRNGQVIPTKHIILTFNCPNLPKRIKAAYLSCPVRPYIPNPLRCFQCQRYGHSKTYCRGSVTCARCAEVGHDSTNCIHPERCVNCKGDHPAFSRSCPKWILEKEIQALKTTNNISYTEARKNVQSRTPSIGKPFSSTLKLQPKQVCDASTQTFTDSLQMQSRHLHSTGHVVQKPSIRSVSPSNTSENSTASPKQHPTKIKQPNKSLQQKNVPQLNKNNLSKPQTSASQTNKKTLIRSKTLSTSSGSNRSARTQPRTPALRAPFARLRGSKQHEHLMHIAMETEAVDGYEDSDDDSSELNILPQNQ